MKKTLLMVALPVSVLGLGLAGFVAVRMANKAPASGDFAKELAAADAAGLQLAQNQTAKKYSFTEIAPESKPEAKTVTKKSTSGNKAVRSKAPTVKAAPEAVAANVVEEIPELTVMAQATGPTHTDIQVPVTPEPAPTTSPAPSVDQGPILRGGSGAGSGRANGGGTGVGPAIGAIFGAVIRGGGVDGDNCDPRGGAHRGPTAIGAQMPVYGQPPRGATRGGGWGGTTAAPRPRVGGRIGL